MRVTYGRRSVPLPWRRCDFFMHAKGFVDDVMFSSNGPVATIVDTIAAMQLQRRAQANAPAAWCWLLVAPCHTRRRAPRGYKECWGRNMQCTSALFIAAVTL